MSLPFTGKSEQALTFAGGARGAALPVASGTKAACSLHHPKLGGAPFLLHPNQKTGEYTVNGGHGAAALGGLGRGLSAGGERLDGGVIG